VKRLRIKEHIVEPLRDQIVHGVRLPGSKIPLEGTGNYRESPHARAA